MKERLVHSNAIEVGVRFFAADSCSEPRTSYIFYSNMFAQRYRFRHIRKVPGSNSSWSINWRSLYLSFLLGHS